jgi:hypothetical protein
MIGIASLAAALREDLGARTPWVEREAERTLDSVRERLDPSTLERAWERGKRLTPDAAVAMALAETG